MGRASTSSQETWAPGRLRALSTSLHLSMPPFLCSEDRSAYALLSQACCRITQAPWQGQEGKASDLFEKINSGYHVGAGKWFTAKVTQLRGQDRNSVWAPFVMAAPCTDCVHTEEGTLFPNLYEGIIWSIVMYRVSSHRRGPEPCTSFHFNMSAMMTAAGTEYQ